MVAKKDPKVKRGDDDAKKDSKSKAKKPAGKKPSVKAAKKAADVTARKVKSAKAAKKAAAKKAAAKKAKSAAQVSVKKSSKAKAKSPEGARRSVKAVKKLAGVVAGSAIASEVRPLSEAGYPNLPLCVIDAVFVQRGRLAATGPVCALVSFGASGKWRPAAYSVKFTTADLVGRLDGIGVSTLVGDVFASETKALGCPDLSRAQVVVELCRALADAGVLTKADARSPEKRDALLQVVRSTRGIGAAGAARLLELAREFEFAGAAWLADHFAAELEREVNATEADALLAATTAELAKSAPEVTARDVAFGIWRAQAGYSPTFRRL